MKVKVNFPTKTTGGVTNKIPQGSLLLSGFKDLSSKLEGKLVLMADG